MNELILLIILYMSIVMHELGHLLAFVIFKVKVRSYDIGVGKTILHFFIREAEFNFKLIPVGGSVIPFEEEYEDLELYKKIIISLSGVFVNLIISILALVVFAKGDLNIVMSIIGDSILLVRNYLSYDNLSFYNTSFTLLLTEEMDSIKSVILNEVIIINFVLFIINLIPIPPLDGSKVITEPLTLFFSTIGIKKKAIYMIINVLSFFGVIVMFIPKISNIIIIFIRDHLKTTVFLQVLIVTLIFVLIYEIKTYKE